MNITDRDITNEELQAIYDDFKKIETQDGIPNNPQARHQYIAEEGDTVIGFVSGLTNHTIFYLTDMWVNENSRRQGLGAKLLQMLEAKIAMAGIEHIYTWTTGANNEKFYESQGYKIFTVFENFCGVEGYHKVGYRKALSS
ncbi:MAG: GNAT family N-acetyltransferase [Defluviitaleaceae bacterium]|nr:GNAT family N-acetyltransferase [Defluviitaleaceae bacterium]